VRAWLRIELAIVVNVCLQRARLVSLLLQERSSRLLWSAWVFTESRNIQCKHHKEQRTPPWWSPWSSVGPLKEEACANGTRARSTRRRSYCMFPHLVCLLLKQKFPGFQTQMQCGEFRRKVRAHLGVSSDLRTNSKYYLYVLQIHHKSRCFLKESHWRSPSVSNQKLCIPQSKLDSWDTERCSKTNLHRFFLRGLLSIRPRKLPYIFYRSLRLESRRFTLRSSASPPGSGSSIICMQNLSQVDSRSSASFRPYKNRFTLPSTQIRPSDWDATERAPLAS